MDRVVKVQVTQDHITRGKRRIGYSCPVALALRDALSDDLLDSFLGDLIYVGRWAASVGDFHYDLDSSLVNYIHAFDGGEIIAPVTLDVDKDGLQIFIGA